MGIYLPNMEMPQNCDKCRFQSTLRLYCDAMPYNFCGNTDDIERPDWCPLIELPPHGRLGDLDELYKVANMADDFGADTTDILKLIIDTPTVIEAEE